MRDEDRAYVKRTWLDAYWDVARRRRYRDRNTGFIDEGGEFQGMRRSVYYELYAPIVDAIFGRSEVFIATMPDLRDTDVVCGFLVTEGDLVHFIHTKSRFRKVGLGRWLVEQIPTELHVTYTHAPVPTVGARLIPASWSFDPLRRFERKAAA